MASSSIPQQRLDVFPLKRKLDGASCSSPPEGVFDDSDDAEARKTKRACNECRQQKVA